MATEFAIAFDLSRQVKPKEAQPKPRYPARIARLLALAHALDARLQAGEFKDYAEMARALGLTRARVTQIMDLLLLAPDIQEEILFMEAAVGEAQINGVDLRSVVAAQDWEEQRRRWAKLSTRKAASK